MQQEGKVIWQRLQLQPFQRYNGVQKWVYNWAKFSPSPPFAVGELSPKSVHPKQHLDLFSCFCTVKPS